jgi:dystonin
VREDIEASKADIDQTRYIGDGLMQLCGEPEKPEVSKNMDELDTNFDNVQTHWIERQKQLDEALRKATEFQTELMRILIWLQGAEEKISELGPIGADTDTVKQQLTDLKVFHFIILFFLFLVLVFQKMIFTIFWH